MRYKITAGTEVFNVDADSPQQAYDIVERAYDEQHGQRAFEGLAVGVLVDKDSSEAITLLRAFCVALEEPRPSDWEHIVKNIIADCAKFRGSDVVRVIPIVGSRD